MSIRLIFFILTLTISNELCSQQIENGNELGGFILGQFRKCVKEQLGSCIQRINTEDGWIYEFHSFKSDTSAYALFKYAASDTLRIQSIQINGHKFDEMRPFLGLKLGDSESKVNSILGIPSRTEKIENPTVRVLYYEKKNYSVEIDESGRLYGIQIFREAPKRAKEIIPSMAPFRNAILKGNIDSLMIILAPDVELYKNGKTISYVGSARSEFQNSNSILRSLLLDDQNGVRAVLINEKNSPVPELRFYPDKVAHSNTSTVYKFYKSKIISEIVLIPEDGEWKVYEIKFR